MRASLVKGVYQSSASVPLVNVCVPVRNGSHTIRHTLDSILAQDYPNLEVIVSDNCSTDNTADIVREYASQGVRYYLNSKLETMDPGESNWNHILSLAQGPFIALYHADDLYTPTTVRRQVEFLQAHLEVSSVFTMCNYIDYWGCPTYPKGPWVYLPDELKGQSCFVFPVLFNAVLKHLNFIKTPTLMTRQETLDTVGYFNHEQFHTSADLDLWLRMARWRPIGIIDEPLHFYRINHKVGAAPYLRQRTKPADFFVVMDHYLAMPDVRQHVEPDALTRYEMHRTFDDLICAQNLVIQGNVAEARARLESACARPVFRAGLRESTFARQYWIGMLLLVTARLGLGNFAGSGYKRMYKPIKEWLRRRRLRLLPQ